MNVRRVALLLAFALFASCSPLSAPLVPTSGASNPIPIGEDAAFDELVTAETLERVAPLSAPSEGEVGRNVTVGARYAGKTVRGATFLGTTTLLSSARGVVFEDCTFDAEWTALYAVRVNASERPFASFIRCTFRNAIGKAAVVQWCLFRECLVTDCGSDGIFSQLEGRLHVERTTIERLGLIPGEGCDGLHADGIQLETGERFTIRGNRIIVPNGCHDPSLGRQGNSAIFIESDFSAVSDVTIVGNELVGGIYTVWVREDKNGPPRNVTIRGNSFDGWTNGSLFRSSSVNQDAGFVYGPNSYGSAR